jgi:hypothetical protein
MSCVSPRDFYVKRNQILKKNSDAEMLNSIILLFKKIRENYDFQVIFYVKQLWI